MKRLQGAIKLRVRKVAEIANPFIDAVWTHQVLKRRMVREAIAANTLQSSPIHIESPIHKHAQRVAYLVQNWERCAPIQVDVGIEGMCYPSITDGMHRLAAALYRKEKTILATVSGQISLIKEYKE